jgi:hypothetical protein
MASFGTAWRKSRPGRNKRQRKFGRTFVLFDFHASVASFGTRERGVSGTGMASFGAGFVHALVASFGTGQRGASEPGNGFVWHGGRAAAMASFGMILRLRTWEGELRNFSASIPAGTGYTLTSAGRHCRAGGDYGPAGPYCVRGSQPPRPFLYRARTRDFPVNRFHLSVFFAYRGKYIVASFPSTLRRGHPGRELAQSIAGRTCPFS